jgi:DNA-binding NarL/FixJ family response regulator
VSGELHILLIEDSDQLAGAVARELERDYGHSVTWLRDPTLLESALTQNHFDVAIIDLLYEHLNREFEASRMAGKVKVRGDHMLVTGLTAIQMLREQQPSSATLIWTSGEATRRLHLLYSYQDLTMRNYCSKSPGTGRRDTLEDAARAAYERRQFIDPVLNPYLPSGRGRTASQILLGDECKRAIWRAIALGAHSRSEIGRAAGYAPRTVGRRIPEMYQDLLEFDMGLPGRRTPLLEVVRYAAMNWHFFLDDAVRSKYP